MEQDAKKLTERVTVRMSRNDKRLLEWMSDEMEASQNDIICDAINRHWAEYNYDKICSMSRAFHTLLGRNLMNEMLDKLKEDTSVDIVARHVLETLFSHLGERESMITKLSNLGLDSKSPALAQLILMAETSVRGYYQSEVESTAERTVKS